MAQNDFEYHRRRSEMELELAAAAEGTESALAHLALARMHRARRSVLAQKNLNEFRRRSAAPIIRADKEA